jgi:hypothetical protein
MSKNPFVLKMSWYRRLRNNIMKFDYICDDIDGLILIDRYFMKDLNDALLYKLDILNRYCPKLLDNPEEIRKIIIKELAAAGIEPVKANKGIIMKTLMPIFKKLNADMKIVNQIISEKLE